ncbi:7a-methyl-1,5-dioxo-octahydro-1H-inden-4-yl [Seminavis robusta]|uniref:7a-methyl-1,5-dioxo-octahydro-1H-inden-4-yl n=1 Tax=Seminavis robusta TaxID=568900 RepID=A0A9N8ERZ2_9STRA|nr:7a-methyl-1,5-dioxo-octahydro-1H-inden-4-yl [Seminavis robusta]|eukprot:Sro1485_g276580.1 7a-methyl-1,5-dioxo-octahydro-1H-inden-4-yl (561) ;mRNA; r:20502-22378
MNQTTFLSAFLSHCEETPDKVWLTQPMNNKGVLKTWTFKEALDEAKQMAGFLESKNFEKGTKIAICSKNCAWWVLADISIMLAGHVSVPVYPTLTRDTTAYILEHSESKLLFVGKLDQKPWEEMKIGIPDDLEKVCLPLGIDSSVGARWNDLIEKAESIKETVDRAPEELATIIYTSGSTGKPKGVMLSFKAMTAAVSTICDVYNISARDRWLSYLPLSHAMERFLMNCCMHSGMVIYYPWSLDTFVVDLQRCRPTVFVSVPRLWMKFQQAVTSKLPNVWLQFLLRIPIIGGLVQKKILSGLGLDACRFAISGSAPISPELLMFYSRLGLNMMEGYGMTENYALSHCGRIGRTRVGYVGETYPGVEHRLTEEGEVEVKTPGLMMGYFKNEEATKATITEDGWLKTGDRGSIDKMGRLKITGRTKEIFKTSKGKYVAPSPIENKLNVSDHIELSCVTGTGFPQPFAILQLSEASKKAASESLKAQAEITKQLEAFRKGSINKVVDPHEALDRLVIVKDEWLPENGLLTPTQKMMRTKIENKYKSHYEQWSSSKKTVVWHGW